MSDINITVSGTKRLLTAGKYCNDNIVITAEGAEPVLQEKTITENGEHTPDDGYDGLSKVTVEIPIRYDEGYSDGVNQAILDYAPMIIHGQEGTGALAPSKFTNVQIGDVTFNYADVLVCTGEGTNTLYLTFDNNNPVLSCTAQIHISCIYYTLSGSMATPEKNSYFDTATITVGPKATKSISFRLDTTAIITEATWQYPINTLQWTIA